MRFDNFAHGSTANSLAPTSGLEKIERLVRVELRPSTVKLMAFRLDGPSPATSGRTNLSLTAVVRPRERVRAVRLPGRGLEVVDFDSAPAPGADMEGFRNEHVPATLRQALQ